MKKAVIIHLSDIHFNDSELSETLLENLKLDLQEMKQQFTTGYDLMLLTGDCVDRGQVERFQDLQNKLNGILKVCSLGRQRVVIVPGNHDSKRNNPWLSPIMEQFKGEKKKIINAIEQDISPLYKEFNDFVESYSRQKNGVGVKYYKVKDMVLRVVFLNSSWSTLAECGYGELHIGEQQLEKIQNEISRKRQKYDLTIACLHHPLDWFEYEERIKLQKFLYNKLKVDFILHGHIHEASYDFASNMDIHTNTFCTGISYHKTGENSSRKDGMRYSIYEIDYDTCTINVYLRATNQESKFVSDNRLYSNVNKTGFFTLPMGNVSQCLMPFKSADRDNKEYKSKIFLSNDFVTRLLDKEDLLFKFYRGMETHIEESFVEDIDKKLNRYKAEYEKKNKKQLDEKEEKECEKEFYKQEFESYCLFVICTLNSLFFKNHQHVRFLLRKYEKTTERHEPFIATGIYSDTLREVKGFKWGEGMIYRSYQMQTALLQSRNMKYHQEGNSHDRWKDYLTIAVAGIEIKKGRELIPLLSINIATDILDNEACLQALAMSSIYDKIQEVFKLFNTKVHDVVSLYSE